MTEMVFTAFDGKQIGYKEWETENPKGLIQISHGMAESLNRYHGFAEFMAKNGYLVFGDDHRCHGNTDSGNDRGYSVGNIFEDTLKDMKALSEIYKKRYPTLKLIVFGHSYGSFLTQAYMEKYGDKAVAFILGGSAYMNNFAIKAGRIFAKLNCAFGKKKKPAEFIAKLSFGAYNKKYKDGTTFISSELKECKRYEEDEDCNFILSNAFYKSFFSGIPKVYRAKNYLKIDKNKPILLISGDSDPVGECGKSVTKLQKFYVDTVGVKDVEKVLYKGVRHEYLNDISREAAYDTILNFCNSKINF